MKARTLSIDASINLDRAARLAKEICPILCRARSRDRAHFHPKRFRQCAHRLPDASDPEDAHSQAIKFNERIIPIAKTWRARPTPIAHGLRVMADMLR